jgi:hypothetical protein
MRAEKRLSHGYTVQLSYTWSKAMQATEWLNAADAVPYRSISDMDRTHRVVITGIWEVPFGRGRRFGTTMPKAANFIAGGWQLNMMIQRQSGPPLGFGDVWTLFTGNPDDVVLPKDKRSVDQWFNINAGFNDDSSDPIDGELIRVADLLAAFVEAFRSIHMGIRTTQLEEGLRIPERWRGRRVGGIDVGAIYADFA